jgi:hypothetical protein
MRVLGMMCVWAVVTTMCCHLASAGKTRNDQRNSLVIMETGDAPGAVDPEKVSECLRLVVRELNLDSRELPIIVLYHISKDAAKYMGIRENFFGRNSGGRESRYEMWIIGKPSNFLYTYMLENILERHFVLRLNVVERTRIIQHVESNLDATVNVLSFH